MIWSNSRIEGSMSIKLILNKVDDCENQIVIEVHQTAQKGTYQLVKKERYK
jgi:hypothetical protein